MSNIIILNGCSSAGKSTLAKNIQNISNFPWLHFSMDAFFDMIAEKYIGFGKNAHEGYLYFSKNKNHRGDLVLTHKGPLRDQVFAKLPKIAKILADAGNNLIIDDVITDQKELNIYLKALQKHNIFCVLVNCPLPILQKREKDRGDRNLGLANAQYDDIVKLKNYNLIIENGLTDSISNAKKILNLIE